MYVRCHEFKNLSGGGNGLGTGTYGVYAYMYLPECLRAPLSRSSAADDDRAEGNALLYCSTIPTTHQIQSSPKPRTASSRSTEAPLIQPVPGQSWSRLVDDVDSLVNAFRYLCEMTSVTSNCLRRAP